MLPSLLALIVQTLMYCTTETSAQVTSSVTLSTATANNNEISKSTVFIVVPTAAAVQIVAIAKASGGAQSCPAPTAAGFQKAISGNWVDSAALAIDLLPQIQVGAELQVIRTVANLQLPVLIHAAEQARQTVVQAAQNNGNLGLTPAGLATVSGVLLFIAFSVQNCLTVDAHTFLIPPEAISGSATRGPALGVTSSKISSSTAECPKPTAKPNCINCGRNAGSSQCLGIKTKANLWQGCPCYDPVKYGFAVDHDEHQQALAQWNGLDIIGTGSPATSSRPADAIPQASLTTAVALASAVITMSPPVCNPWEDRYSTCFKSIDTKKLNDTAAQLCETQMPGWQLTSRSPNVTQIYKAGSGVVYIANVGWIPGCTKVSSQDPKFPMGEGDPRWTYNIVFWNWKYCPDNHGLGGYTDVGCLRIGFYPTRLSGVYAAPPRPSVYFVDKNQKYC